MNDVMSNYTVDEYTGCWLWIGSHAGAGYGKLKHEGVTYLAHRIFYEVHVGDIPKELELDHLCRIRHCVNPKHLEAVTHKVNIRRGITGRITGERMSAKTHCKYGHEFTDVNTRIWTNNRGNTQRVCITCNKKRLKRYHAKRRLKAL